MCSSLFNRRRVFFFLLFIYIFCFLFIFLIFGFSTIASYRYTTYNGGFRNPLASGELEALCSSPAIVQCTMEGPCDLPASGGLEMLFSIPLNFVLLHLRLWPLYDVHRWVPVTRSLPAGLRRCVRLRPLYNVQWWVLATHPLLAGWRRLCSIPPNFFLLYHCLWPLYDVQRWVLVTRSLLAGRRRCVHLRPLYNVQWWVLATRPLLAGWRCLLFVPVNFPLLCLRL